MNVRRIVLMLLLAVVMPPAAGRAQTPNPTQNVEVEPVTCWWRTEAASVRIGQPFTLLLTCSALETDAARAVIDRSRMSPQSVQFPPFEVVGGTQGDDRLTPGRRFMQYEYILRLINEDAFGHDIAIPEMSISYRIESKVQQDSVQGREQTYNLPPIPLRITTLVPDQARHIRESGVPTLTQIASREFRARMFRLVALILFGVAGLTLAVAIVRRLTQKRGERTEATRHLVPARAILGSVRAELRSLRQETRGGWSPDSVARGLTVSRIVGSYVAGHSIAQRPITGEVSPGELRVGGGFLSRRAVAVSGATTGQSLNGHGSASAALAPDMDNALMNLTRAHYGRTDALDGSSLDDALATASRAADRVASRHSWLAETSAAAARSVRGWMPDAWAR